MLRTILVYGALLAALAVGLQWLEFQYVMRTHATETYVVLIAVAFLGLGLWAGARLFRRSPPGEFVANPQPRPPRAIADVSPRGRKLLPPGLSKKKTGGHPSRPPNTVKTHIARLFEKLEARRRTEVILRARELGMIR